MSPEFFAHCRPLRARWLTVLLIALALAALPAGSEELFGRRPDSGTPSGGRDDVKFLTDGSDRQAPAGTRNLICVAGAIEDGGTEAQYSVDLQQIVGGERLHGVYEIKDIVSKLVSAGLEKQPVSNLYFCGHIVLTPSKNFPAVVIPHPNDTYLGWVLVGKQEKFHILNLVDQFVKAYDQALNTNGLTPADIWAKDARIDFKMCLVAYYCRDFLEKLANRVPEGTIIEAYTVPYTWNTAFGLGLFSHVLARFNQKELFGEQAEGLTHIPGRWRPGPIAPASARQEGAAGFGGLEQQ